MRPETDNQQQCEKNSRGGTAQYKKLFPDITGPMKKKKQEQYNCQKDNIKKTLEKDGRKKDSRTDFFDAPGIKKANHLSSTEWKDVVSHITDNDRTVKMEGGNALDH